MNFPDENVRQSKTKNEEMNAAEGVRYVIGRILRVAANSKAEFDLCHLLR